MSEKVMTCEEKRDNVGTKSIKCVFEEDFILWWQTSLFRSIDLSLKKVWEISTSALNNIGVQQLSIGFSRFVDISLKKVHGISFAPNVIGDASASFNEKVVFRDMWCCSTTSHLSYTFISNNSCTSSKEIIFWVITKF